MSAASSVYSKRTASGKEVARMRRNVSYSKKLNITDDDAYIYALRTAYLAYLLLPRQKRIQHVANTSKPIQRSSTSINDMVKDFNLIRDSKSTRFPHGFMSALDKRVTGVLYGQETMREYNDAAVKRTFGAFLNEFKNPTFRKSMDKDRRVEDLLLIFYSRATTELQKGKASDDDSWKLLVDRHVALFVRLLGSTLDRNDWVRDRPELKARLKTLEDKLLRHDENLTSENQKLGDGTRSIEVEVPRSYEVRDMPLVIRICRIFSKPTVVAQEDINQHKAEWTEKAALKDLKDYQNHMMLGNRVTLSRDDFDLDEAFEAWRKGEFADLSQMMLALVQSNPELAKATPGSSLPAYKSPHAVRTESGYSDIARSLSKDSTDVGSAYVADQPVDMSALNLEETSPRDSATGSLEGDRPAFTFIPPDAQAYYRHVLKVALSHDLLDDELNSSAAGGDSSATKLLSQQSTELLNELALRWRIPQFSRVVLFLDVVREKFIQLEISLDTMDAAFLVAKTPPSPPKKSTSKGASLQGVQPSLFDRNRWTLQDVALMQSILNSLHEALLRHLFETFQQCYEQKPPSIGPVMYVLDNHIYDDPLFNQPPEALDPFTKQLRLTMQEKAYEKYTEILHKHISDDANQWEFYHVIQLGKSVTALCQKIQKRYRGNPEVMGVNPLQILVEEALPALAGDLRHIISKIMELSKEKGEEIPLQDGIDLYAELVDIRNIYAQALPGRQFDFHVEGLLQEFVWRLIAQTDSKMVSWVENAVEHDNFALQRQHEGEDLSDDQRHSSSVLDTFSMISQSIEPIVKLNWDDDLQYAKFMTAASKTVGHGITRYCELLETRFAKEMNRQSPEQEAAALRTQKERWVAMAREAWNQKEKIEPFQFLPESLVKLNDIEYAMLQLDKTEKEVNVDACAEVIQKREPPPPPRLRNNKYVFTIKIIEAEDLMAGDVNGLSDPYVVLGDEYQKRLAKTRTIYQSLNPRWDETIDIVTTGPLNIIATVWDWDTLGDHDCLGRTSLKLDPTHFNDYMPREYWLDLDTKGRVLLRVSMEGERDDIQFHFGKAFRTLKRTERDMARKITDKLSAYIHQCLSRRALRQILQPGGVTGAGVSYVRGYFNKASGRPQSVIHAPNKMEIESALKPLTEYFDDNFAIMKRTLTSTAMTMVMTRVWKEVLVTIESLLIPPLSDKVSQQRPLAQMDVDIVYKWLDILFDFFHAYDEEDKVSYGVPQDELKTQKYTDLKSLYFFYFESTEHLIRVSEGMAAANATKQQEQAARLNNRLSAPASFGVGGSLLGLPSTRRSKSIMMSRNLGTMRKAKEEKRKEAQADPSDDMILRILRMRPEAERYLRDRSRQKERLAAAAAAELIVRQSLQAGRMGQAGPGAGLGRR